MKQFIQNKWYCFILPSIFFPFSRYFWVNIQNNNHLSWAWEISLFQSRIEEVYLARRFFIVLTARCVWSFDRYVELGLNFFDSLVKSPYCDYMSSTPDVEESPTVESHILKIESAMESNQLKALTRVETVSVVMKGDTDSRMLELLTSPVRLQSPTLLHLF